MNETSKRVKGGRALLNLPGHHSTAAIVAELVPGTGYSYINISDCSRQISIECPYADADDFENTLYKVDTMIDCLQKYRKALKAEGRKKGW
jgi:hypothetical protein